MLSHVLRIARVSCLRRPRRIRRSYADQRTASAAEPASERDPLYYLV